MAGNESKKDQGVLYLGIDLGTSRTSVTASNGCRETVASYVGYPKDVVSKKLLKKDVLFGDEALEKRLSLNLFRPLGHGVIKEKGGSEDADNLKAAQDLIGEIIRRAKPRKDELIYAVIGAPAQASINNKGGRVGSGSGRGRAWSPAPATPRPETADPRAAPTPRDSPGERRRARRGPSRHAPADPGGRRFEVWARDCPLGFRASARTWTPS
jgi:hypothetical protein